MLAAVRSSAMPASAMMRVGATRTSSSPGTPTVSGGPALNRLARGAEVLRVHLDGAALGAGDGLAPGDQLRPDFLGDVVPTHVGVVGDPAFGAVGDEFAAIWIVQVKVHVAALEAAALVDRQQLQIVLIHPGAQLGQAVATLVRGRAIAQVLAFVRIGHLQALLPGVSSTSPLPAPVPRVPPTPVIWPRGF